MKKTILLVFIVPALLLFGCSKQFKTQYFGVEDEAIFAPKEFAETAEAVEKAKAGARSEYQYRKIEEAMEQGRLAAMTYWECHDEEARALLALARQSAHRAEMYHPQPPPPGVARTFATVAPPAPPESLSPDKPFAGVKTVPPGMILNSVYFPFDSAALTLTDPDQLKSQIGVMQSKTEYEIAGHTDNIGDPSYNQRLSERRARNLKTYLEKQGVASEKMIPTGYGEGGPAMPNETDTGRAKNRRAEIRVLPPVFPAPEIPSYSALPAGTTIEMVHFSFASNQLLPVYKTALDKTLEMLDGDTDLNLEVAGYADHTGPEDVNRRLSGKRAQIVADYLVKKGVDTRRIIVRAYGEADPFASNETVKGRSLNRRVEVKIQKPGR